MACQHVFKAVIGILRGPFWTNGRRKAESCQHEQQASDLRRAAATDDTELLRQVCGARRQHAYLRVSRLAPAAMRLVV